MEPNASMVIDPRKGRIAAILLPLFLGPIGLLYSCFWTAIAVGFLFLFALSKGRIGAVGAVFIWILEIYLSVFFVRRQNKQWLKQKTSSGLAMASKPNSCTSTVAEVQSVSP